VFLFQGYKAMKGPNLPANLSVNILAYTMWWCIVWMDSRQCLPL